MSGIRLGRGPLASGDRTQLRDFFRGLGVGIRGFPGPRLPAPIYNASPCPSPALPRPILVGDYPGLERERIPPKLAAMRSKTTGGFGLGFELVGAGLMSIWPAFAYPMMGVGAILMGVSARSWYRERKEAGLALVEPVHLIMFGLIGAAFCLLVAAGGYVWQQYKAPATPNAARMAGAQPAAPQAMAVPKMSAFMRLL